LSRQRLRLLLDENIGLRVYEELKRRGYEVQIVIKKLHGTSGEVILRIALNNDKTTMTIDKDLSYIVLLGLRSNAEYEASINVC